MPAYNAEATLRESVECVLAQTYEAWKLLILDDGSTDRTPKIAEEFAANEPRIQVVRLKHQGLCGVLNHGLGMATTPLIGRLDSDDICHRERLQKQIAFLTENPDVKVLGTWGRRINDAGKWLSKMHLGPGSRTQYAEQLERKEPFFLIHSSVVADRDNLLRFGGYRQADYPSEDVWLWTRIAQEHPVLAYPEELVGYRINGKGISGSNFAFQHTQTARLRYSLEVGKATELDEFRGICSREPLRRLALRRDYLHRYWLRRGAGYFFNGRPVAGALYLALSTLMNPLNIITRAIHRS